MPCPLGLSIFRRRPKGPSNFCDVPWGQEPQATAGLYPVCLPLFHKILFSSPNHLPITPLPGTAVGTGCILSAFLPRKTLFLPQPPATRNPLSMSRPEEAS